MSDAGRVLACFHTLRHPSLVLEGPFSFLEPPWPVTRRRLQHEAGPVLSLLHLAAGAINDRREVYGNDHIAALPEELREMIRRNDRDDDE